MQITIPVLPILLISLGVFILRWMVHPRAENATKILFLDSELATHILIVFLVAVLVIMFSKAF